MQQQGKGAILMNEKIKDENSKTSIVSSIKIEGCMPENSFKI